MDKEKKEKVLDNAISGTAGALTQPTALVTTALITEGCLSGPALTGAMTILGGSMIGCAVVFGVAPLAVYGTIKFALKRRRKRKQMRMLAPSGCSGNSSCGITE